MFFALMPCHANAANMSYGSWELDGFLRNNTGIWLENWDYAANNDPLATCRNWFRLNLNGKISPNLKLKAEILAIYEPEYPRERHGVDGGEPIRANYYNYFDFRELRLDWQPKVGHNVHIGRQIVNWGESISARVGDVINPQDNRFDLGFTNLEDTRMPIWMIRGIHQLFSVRTTFDWIFSPYVEPDRYRVTRQPSNIGNVNTDGSFIAGPRFGPYPETLKNAQGYRGFDFYYGVPGTPTTPAFFAPAKFIPGIPVIGAPFDRMWSHFDASTAGFLFGGPEGYYLTGAPNILHTDYPDASLENARWGFKTSTNIIGCQTGVYFWSANEMDGTFRIESIYTGGFDIRLQYPRQNVYGFYANKNFDFGVLRMDVAYRPEREYNTLDQTATAGIENKDFLIVQFGINKDFLWQKLNPNSTFGFIAEYVGEYFLTDDMDEISIPSYYVPLHKDSHTLMASLGTSYDFGKYGYDLTALYNFTEGGNGLIQPKFTYNPNWMNRRWKFALMYTTIFGDDYAYPYGLAKEKDMLVLTTQFSFP